VSPWGTSLVASVTGEMIERLEGLEGLPTGVLGFKGTGKISRDEYQEMMGRI